MKMRWNIPAVVARVCNPWRRARMNAGHGLKTRATLCDGLTFLEVMFAVIILGIGFIMLAAIFPVAMQQQQAALESTQADAIFGSATATLRQLAVQKISSHPNPAPPPSAPNTAGPFSPYDTGTAGMVRAFDDESWNEVIAGNVIDAANPHYAWCALYVRSGTTTPASTVNVLVFALASRNQAVFGAGDLAAPSGYESNVEAHEITVNAVKPSGTPGNNTITIERDNKGLSQAACPGAYVVMQDVAAGHDPFVYQLGALDQTNSTATADVWYISPAQDLDSSKQTGGGYTNPEEVTSPVQAWVIGRSYKTVNENPGAGPLGPVIPADPSTTPVFSGNCQVIGYASSYDNPKLVITIPTGSGY